MLSISRFTIVLLVSKLHQETVCDQNFSHIPECNQYQSCNNEIINSTTRATICCHGAQSCNNSWIRSSSLRCEGYGACSRTTVKTYTEITYEQDCNAYGTCMESNLSAANMIFCAAPYSCSGSNLRFSEDGSKQTRCTALHSCINTTFKSLSSYSQVPSISN